MTTYPHKEWPEASENNRASDTHRKVMFPLPTASKHAAKCPSPTSSSVISQKVRSLNVNAAKSRCGEWRSYSVAPSRCMRKGNPEKWDTTWSRFVSPSSELPAASYDSSLTIPNDATMKPWLSILYFHYDQMKINQPPASLKTENTRAGEEQVCERSLT